MDGDPREVIRILQIEVAKLDLKSGDRLAMIAPEGWGPSMLANFQAYADVVFAEQDLKLFVLPYGTELQEIREENLG